MVKKLLFGCALASAVIYLGSSLIEDTVRSVQKKQELREARANRF
jgi:hypothetical protein